MSDNIDDREKSCYLLFFCFALNECLQLVYEEESVSGPVVLSLPPCWFTLFVWCLRGGNRLTTESVTMLFPLLSLLQPSYLALAELLSNLRTAWAMPSRSMPKIRSSSWGLPLRGTWETARRWTVKPVSFTTAEHTASPRPPEESEYRADKTID